MSINALRDLASELPSSIADQIVGYAESVERALPEIAQSAGRRFSDSIFDQVVFVAGLQKLYGIVSSSYWTLDNSASMLESMGANSIRVGRTDFSRGGEFHNRVKALLNSLDKALLAQGITEYMRLSPRDLLLALSKDERR